MEEGRAIGYSSRNQIPEASGVYTAWLAGERRCFYVGRATNSKAGNLKNRISSHFRGQRGSDQFCLYVYDSYIFPARYAANENLTTKDVNRRTGSWIQEHVSFRWVEVLASEAPAAEAELRQRMRPILNPL